VRTARRYRATLAAAAVVALVTGCGAVPAPGTEILIRNSRFAPDRITVPADRPVTIVLRNQDPIDHEWIVGDAALHERHRTGTEPVHDVRPTEVTVPAGSTRTTTVTVPTGAEWTFICHLPGHEDYGMTGSVEVGDG
jgi:uncharacterized cupredoxin-like copper-binding protein